MSTAALATETADPVDVVVAAEVTLDWLDSFALTGALIWHVDQHALPLETDEGPERLSINLSAYDLHPMGLNHVYVKDWSEHSGLTDNLVAKGLVSIVRRVRVGQFSSLAYEVAIVLPVDDDQRSE